MKRIVITNDMLVGACCGQRKLFRQTWPDGAAVTKVNALRAAKMGLDHGWVALHLLPPELHDEYRAQRKPIDDEYDAKCKLIDDECDAKCKLIDDECDAKCWIMLCPLLRKALAQAEGDDDETK